PHTTTEASGGAAGLVARVLGGLCAKRSRQEQPVCALYSRTTGSSFTASVPCLKIERATRPLCQAVTLLLGSEDMVCLTTETMETRAPYGGGGAHAGGAADPTTMERLEEVEQLLA
ncbi:unnamed protein product, partial [Ectocarpus sp. 6 AP-2014]